MTARLSRPPRGPFARPFDVRSFKGDPREVEIVATEAERQAVATALSLPRIDDLTASFRLIPRAGGRVDLTGTVRAAVTQTCVISLEPFDSPVSHPVELEFAPAPSNPRRGQGRDVEVSAPSSVGGNDEQEDPPDPIVDDVIDLGAVAVEFLALGLDPYPRKPGVHFDDTVVGEKDAPAPSAFAALARLKDEP